MNADLEILLDLANMSGLHHGSYQNEYEWLITYLKKIPKDSSVRGWADEWLDLFKLKQKESASSYYFSARLEVMAQSKIKAQTIACQEIEDLKKQRRELSDKMSKVNARLLRLRVTY